MFSIECWSRLQTTDHRLMRHRCCRLLRQLVLGLHRCCRPTVAVWLMRTALRSRHSIVALNCWKILTVSCRPTIVETRNANRVWRETSCLSRAALTAVLTIVIWTFSSRWTYCGIVVQRHKPSFSRKLFKTVLDRFVLGLVNSCIDLFL